MLPSIDEEICMSSFWIILLVQKPLMQKQEVLDKYTCSGVYKLTCPDCNKAYTGQTGRSFAERYKEYKYAFKPTATLQIMLNIF
jgi:transposase-like protein